MPFVPAALPDDVDALKAIIADMARDALVAKSEIERLSAQLARLKRSQFGRSSEKLSAHIEQLELALEALESDEAERLAALPAMAELVEAGHDKTKPARRPLPDHLPREEIVHAGACSCPSCGGSLRRIGADVTETLDYVPGRFKVVRHVREAFSCRACESVVQTPAPHHAIARGRAGAGLLAHIMVSKFDDHLPLHRQAEIYARSGVELNSSTLSGWVGATAAALAPAEARRHGIRRAAWRRYAGGGARTGFGQDEDRPLLGLCARRAPASRQTTTGGRLLLLARPHGRAAPGASEVFTGVLHADGYAGFKGLYESGRKPGPIVEAACWAHARRKFHDVHAANGSEVARQALERIGALYAIEQEIRGQPPDERRRRRQARSLPIAEDLRRWAQATLAKLSGRSELAKAFRYMLARWPALIRCFADGRLEIDNNAAERALRGVAVGRKNYLFAGSDRGGERAAAIYSLIETAKLNGLDPQAWLRDVLERIADHPNSRIGELLPWNWSPATPAAEAA